MNYIYVVMWFRTSAASGKKTTARLAGLSTCYSGIALVARVLRGRDVIPPEFHYE